MKRAISFYCGPKLDAVGWVTYIPSYLREDEAYLNGDEYGDKIIREEIIFEKRPWKFTGQRMHEGQLPDPEIMQGLDGKWYVVEFYHEGPACAVTPLEEYKHPL